MQGTNWEQSDFSAFSHYIKPHLEYGSEAYMKNKLDSQIYTVV